MMPSIYFSNLIPKKFASNSEFPFVIFSFSNPGETKNYSKVKFCKGVSIVSRVVTNEEKTYVNLHRTVPLTFHIFIYSTCNHFTHSGSSNGCQEKCLSKML